MNILSKKEVNIIKRYMFSNKLRSNTAINYSVIKSLTSNIPHRSMAIVHVGHLRAPLPVNPVSLHPNSAVIQTDCSGNYKVVVVEACLSPQCNLRNCTD